MANSWSYAELSKAASAVGGPEKYIKIIEDASRSTGRKEMVPFVIIAALGGAAFVVLKDKWSRMKSHNSQEALNEAKTELIEGIKNYDEEHQNDEEETENVEVTPWTK